MSLALSVEQQEMLRRKQREDLPTESDMFVVEGEGEMGRGSTLRHCQLV